MTTHRFFAAVRLLVVAGGVWLALSQAWAQGQGSRYVLKVGVLFSQTGPMAQSEKPLIDSTLLGIKYVNEEGVPLQVNPGSAEETKLHLEPIVLDGASDPLVFAARAEELCRVHHVNIIFGCWTSDSRKAVLKVLQREHGLLFYPVQYEGGEQSPNCVYSGLTAQQQLPPALDWLVKKAGPRIYLVGSDYVYPRAANRLARQYLKSQGATVVGEAYRPRGSSDFTAVARDILATRAQGVLNTVNGDSLTGFFQSLEQVGLKSDKLTVMSTSMGEVEAHHAGPAALGQYSCAGYFMSLDSPLNRLFKEKYRLAYGADALINDAAAMACSQVWTLAQAVSRAHSAKPSLVREMVRGLIMESPGGLVRYDRADFHCWRVVRIGRVVDKSQFRVVWSSEVPLPPEPTK